MSTSSKLDNCQLVCDDLLELAKERCTNFIQLLSQGQNKANDPSAKRKTNCLVAGSNLHLDSTSCSCCSNDIHLERARAMKVLKEAISKARTVHCEKTEPAKEAKVLFWKYLHTGDWRGVPVSDREGYAAAGILVARGLLLQKNTSYKGVLKELDLVLLLSGDDYGNKLSTIVQDLHDNVLQQSFESRTERKSKRRCVQSSTSSKAIHRTPCTLHGKQLNRVKIPSLAWFLENAMKKSQPVVVTEAMTHWPCFSTSRPWKDLSYLESIAGYRLVPVEFGKNYMQKDWTQNLMRFSDFVKQCLLDTADKASRVGYLAQHRLFDQIPKLRQDIVIPDYCALSLQESFADDPEINVWMGPAGTESNLHFDPKHNLLCQVVGSKYIRLYHPEDSSRLYPHCGKMSNTSQVETVFESPDRDEKYPLFKETPYLECLLHEGQILYIPPRHWHYVRSMENSISVSFWWD